MKLNKQYFLGIGGVLLIIIGSFGLYCWSALHTPLISPGGTAFNFVVGQGVPVRKIATMLQEHHLIRAPLVFTLFAKLKGVEHSLQAGEYKIEPGITPLKLLTKMVVGDVVRHAFTIVEGWNFAQMMAALNSTPYLKHTLHKLTPEEIMAALGHPNELPEGRFAPDTYLFSGEVSDRQILRQAYQLMVQRLAAAWEERASNATYHCPYEALIVASLIEKETAITEEKPIIAGVILRRLAHDRLLQIDAAVIYGLGDQYRGRLRKEDYLKDSPYNTYKHKGLPPSPIAMPSLSSLVAALHPTAGTTLYYVAKGDGTHKFSDTYREQDRAVKQYLRKKR